MRNLSQDVAFKATQDWDHHTAHALLVTAFNKAHSLGLFTRLDAQLRIKMKKRTYSWSDKLATLWASIVVGCHHTVEINDKLGSHETAAARMFGLDRFPDQSQITAYCGPSRMSTSPSGERFISTFCVARAAPRPGAGG